jgi:hypothetical protein
MSTTIVQASQIDRGGEPPEPARRRIVDRRLIIASFLEINKRGFQDWPWLYTAPLRQPDAEVLKRHGLFYSEDAGRWLLRLNTHG